MIETAPSAHVHVYSRHYYLGLGGGGKREREMTWWADEIDAACMHVSELLRIKSGMLDLSCRQHAWRRILPRWDLKGVEAQNGSKTVNDSAGRNLLKLV